MKNKLIKTNRCSNEDLQKFREDVKEFLKAEGLFIKVARIQGLCNYGGELRIYTGAKNTLAPKVKSFYGGYNPQSKAVYFPVFLENDWRKTIEYLGDCLTKSPDRKINGNGKEFNPGVAQLIKELLEYGWEPDICVLFSHKHWASLCRTQSTKRNGPKYALNQHGLHTEKMYLNDDDLLTKLSKEEGLDITKNDIVYKITKQKKL